MTFNIGCSGWSYEGWKGNFYPKDMENKDYLSYYSKFFKFVEVDSTYYRIPSRFSIRGWKELIRRRLFLFISDREKKRVYARTSPNGTLFLTADPRGL